MKKLVPSWLICLLVVTLASTGLSPARPAATVPLSLPGESAEGQHRIGPGQSISEALSKVQPGETLYLAPGTYDEPVYVTTSGRPGA